MAVPPVLTRKRALGRAALWWEQAWPATWPAVGVAGVFAVLALLDAPAWLPHWARIALPIVFGLTAAGALWRGWRGVVRPSAGAVDRRLERESGLRHQPLAMLADRPAASEGADGVWEEHVRRMRAQIGRLRVGAPRPGLARRDPIALRGALLLALGAALVVAGPERGTRLLRAVAPGWPAGVAAPGTVVQAWVTPPAYTALPPRFLRGDQRAIALPAGSHLTISVTGGTGTPGLDLAGAAVAVRALDATSWQAETDVTQGGVLRVTQGLGTVANWDLTVVADRPPTAAWAEPPGAAQTSGRPTLQSRFAWQAEDDYGLAAVRIELRLRDRPDAVPLIVPVPLAGSPKAAHAALVQDLTAHPWAGLPVQARVAAEDAVGQTGVSADAGFMLPERAFENPVAQALVAIRRQLSLTPGARQPARIAIEALADHPEAFDQSIGVLLNLRAISALLMRGRAPLAVEEAQGRMWALALALEEGALDRTARALEAARQELRDAMEAARDRDTTPEERRAIEEKTQALREAIQRQIEALMEQARRDGTELPFDPQAPQMNSRDLDKLAQQMQDAAKAGKMDEAREKMAELERLLEQLQNARPESGEAKDSKNAERRQRGQQQMNAVQDIVRREGGLLDRAQGRAQTRPDPAAPREAEQRTQKALRRGLGELMQRFGDLTGQVPPSLGEADTAMRDAAEALAQGQDAAAGSAQQRAIEALQKGGREMGQQMARQFGQGQEPGEGEGEDGQGDEPGNQGQGQNAEGNRPGQTTGPRPGEQPGPSRRRSARRDPLGRPAQQGTSGAEESSDVRVPDQMEQARTRALQDELRRRGGERTRPQPELDYIDRLLKPF